MQATALVVVLCPLVMGAMMFFMMRGPGRSGDGSSDRPRAAASAPRSRYIRNLKTHAVTVWAAGARLTLAPRGSTGDAAALPSGAFQDPDFLGFVDLGWVEEIDAQAFLARSVLRRSAGNGKPIGEQKGAA